MSAMVCSQANAAELKQLECYKKAVSGEILRNTELKEADMRELFGKYVTVFYEKEDVAAHDVFELAEKESPRIARLLGFAEPVKINIYVYDKQETFWSKRMGFLSQIMNFNWYIGDNRGTDVLLLSPANTNSDHSYDSIKNAVVHEMVHAYNSVLNPNMKLWFNEGLAVYLAGQKPVDDFYKYFSIPEISQMHTADNAEFSEFGGYQFAYTYIAYLAEKYGFHRVLEFAKTADYEQTFGKSEKEIYSEWKELFDIK